MRELSLLLVGALFLSVHATAQDNLKKVEGTSSQPSEEVYVNEEGEYFAKVFYVAFKNQVTENIEQSKDIRSSNIRLGLAAFKSLFSEFEKNHGLQQMERLHPEAVPNDTIRYNKKGEEVVVHDQSKIYKLVFEDIKSLKSIRENFTDPNIRYVEQPPSYYLNSTYPNDPYFDNQWTHKILESEKVFNITEGDPNIIIGISDSWSTSSSGGVHEDMDGRVIAYQYGKWVHPTYSHGPRIALIAAASNNNSKGISSLGGNMKVAISGIECGGNCIQPNLPYIINLSPAQRPDVLNMSWNGGNSSTTQGYLQDLLDLGVILVTGAGNFGNPPGITYPSGYNFDNGEQVISVTATQLTDDVGQLSLSVPLDPPMDPFQYEERFRWEDGNFIFNYGLDNDPINNPDSSFIDVAAPAGWIFTAKGETATNDYGGKWGATSEAAPLVTSVIAMMLSVNPDLKGNSQAVYDILTSTTEYDDIVVPPGTATTTLGDGRKYNKYVGFGRVNAFEAVKAALPKAATSITSNTTWSGYIHVENSVYIESGATLTVLPGTTVLLDDNKALVVKPGGKLIADGTQADPIVFKSVDPDFDWNVIALNSSSGNILDWCLIEGGYINLSIASKNNTISHTTSRDATYRTMQGWYNQDGSGNASATITYSLFENSPTVGMVAHYIDIDMSYNTIRYNTQSGLYLLSGTIDSFHHNEVRSNGGSTRDGIEVRSSGNLSMLNSGTGHGYNEIISNGDDQISNSGTLLIGTNLYGGAPVGNNKVYDYYSGSHYLVDNNTGTMVNALNTFWGAGPLSSGMFDGSVNTYNPLSSDPTLGVAHGYGGQAPSKAVANPELGGNEEEIVSAFNDVESKLGTAITGQEVRDELLNLYLLAWVSDNKELTERFDQIALTTGKGATSFYDSPTKRMVSKNYAKVLYGKSLIRQEKYEEANRYLNELNTEELEGYDKRDYLHLKMVTETYLGAYQQAWETLQAYYSFQESQEENMEEVRLGYAPFEEDLLHYSKGNGIDVQELEEQNPENEDQILTAYPNPFNPTTTIKFTVQQKANVSLKVFDLLGREVAELVSGQLEAGQHQARFDASQLSTGVYMYQLKVGNNMLSKKMTLIK